MVCQAESVNEDAQAVKAEGPGRKVFLAGGGRDTVCQQLDKSSSVMEKQETFSDELEQKIQISG